MANKLRVSKSGSGAPTAITPDFLGQIYIDEDTGTRYEATALTKGSWVDKLSLKENAANKKTSLTDNSDTYYPTQKAVKTYVDCAVAGLLDYRGGYDASGNTYPTTGGSGTAGAVLKGDMWIISVAGTLGGEAVQVGDSIIANVDTPAQTASNWNHLNANISYVPENVANKETTALDTSTTKYPCNNVVKEAVDAKQNSLGYTAENAANKVTSFQENPDDTHYASEKLVKDSLDAKQDTMAKASGSDIDTGTDDSKYATAKAIKDSGIVSTAQANEFSGLTEKEEPADDDLILIEDSAASYAKKKVKLSSLGGGGDSVTFFGENLSKNTGYFAMASEDIVANSTIIWVGYFSDGGTLTVIPYRMDSNGDMVKYGSQISITDDFCSSLCVHDNKFYYAYGNFNTYSYFKYATANGTTTTTNNISFSGTAPATNDFLIMYHDGTYLYIGISSSYKVYQFRRYTISGSTATYVDTITAGTPITSGASDRFSNVFIGHGTQQIKLSTSTMQKYTMNTFTAGSSVSIANNKSLVSPFGGSAGRPSYLPISSSEGKIFIPLNNFAAFQVRSIPKII